MTAEIALLNKAAVAPAADSAATVSSGSKEEKVFNSEDKLFELSNVQPIGIMIYNSSNFLGTPIHILIKKYRSLNRYFNNIDAASTDFREYLRDFAKSLSEEVRNKHFENLAKYPIDLVFNRVNDKIAERVQSRIGVKSTGGIAQNPINLEEIILESVSFYKAVFAKAGDAKITGKASIKKGRVKVQKSPVGMSANIDRALANLIDAFLKSGASSSSSTGFVVAGFGHEELFPSLRSFEIDGLLEDELRYANCTDHDITLEGNSAKVLPFAQQDMVDRFVTGIDEKSQAEIEKFCRDRLTVLHNGLVDVLGIEDPGDEATVKGLLEKANKEYIRGLIEDGFGPIKTKSKEEMEGMVEFMPKSDLAQMAESLVELTSIKRRVSRGFETVGGPIDVAVISRSDGFVWIKRKHYFPPDLNARFFEKSRMAVQSGSIMYGNDDDITETGARARSTSQGSGRGKRSPRSTGRRNDTGPQSSPRSVRKREAEKDQNDS